MGRGAEEPLSPPASPPELEQDDDDEDCYLSDQEDDALEESVLQVLEDGHLEDCHWSSSSVRASILPLLVSTPGRSRLILILKDSSLSCSCR
jgi:ariadne-1